MKMCTKIINMKIRVALSGGIREQYTEEFNCFYKVLFIKQLSLINKTLWKQQQKVTWN